MDNISSQIGALELDDHPESYGDGVLEATMAGPALTTAMCPRIDDGALEAAQMGPNTTQFCTMRGSAGCASDGMLETAADSNVGRTITNCTMATPQCVSDGALETAATSFGPAPYTTACQMTSMPICPR